MALVFKAAQTAESHYVSPTQYSTKCFYRALNHVILFQSSLAVDERSKMAGKGQVHCCDISQGMNDQLWLSVLPIQYSICTWHIKWWIGHCSYTSTLMQCYKFTVHRDLTWEMHLLFVNTILTVCLTQYVLMKN